MMWNPAQDPYYTYYSRAFAGEAKPNGDCVGPKGDFHLCSGTGTVFFNGCCRRRNSPCDGGKGYVCQAGGFQNKQGKCCPISGKDGGTPPWMNIFGAGWKPYKPEKGSFLDEKPECYGGLLQRTAQGWFGDPIRANCGKTFDQKVAKNTGLPNLSCPRPREANCGNPEGSGGDTESDAGSDGGGGDEAGGKDVDADCNVYGFAKPLCVAWKSMIKGAGAAGEGAGGYMPIMLGAGVLVALILVLKR